jgi:hypothetical protein
LQCEEINIFNLQKTHYETRTIIKIKTNSRMGRNVMVVVAQLGTALDAASRGYKTILVEAVDFAKELLAEVLN